MILYESNETEFKSQGICNLNASLNWHVTEAINSTYELEMEYPIDDKYFNEIKFRRIIYAKPSPHALPQPFRIYDITTSINRTILVNAAHISYDLSGYPVEPFTANSALNAITELKKHVVPECPFVFKTDITESGEIQVTMPKSARSILGNNISTAYKPQFFFDHFTVDLKNSRGSDNGVEIRYGKNMLDMKQEENISNVYTAVYPFWKSDEEGLVVLPEKTISTPGTYNYTKIYILDLSNEYTEKPTLDQIREKTNNYIESEKLGIPKVSLTLSFVQLSTSKEYTQYGLLDKIDLGDTVKVVFEEAGVETTAKCVKTIYNGKTNRYDTIEIGEAVKTLADGLVSSTEDVYNSIDTDKENTKSYFEKALEEITNAITGNSGGYVRFNPPKNPSEILIMDTDDMNTATIVWRWNKSGLGVSRTGYNGPYVGIGQNGKLVIDEATANKISAGIIEGGLLKSFNGESQLNMEDGTFDFANGNFNYDGINLTMIGSIINVLNGFGIEMNRGGLKLVSQGENVGGLRSSRFNEDARINGVTISTLQDGDYIDFSSSSNSDFGGAIFNAKLRIATIEHELLGNFKGIQFLDNVMLKYGKTLYIQSGDTDKNNWNEIYNSVKDNLCFFGDNGIILGYKNGANAVNVIEVYETPNAYGSQVFISKQLSMLGEKITSVSDIYTGTSTGRYYNEDWCGSINKQAKRISNLNVFYDSGWYGFTIGSNGAPTNYGVLLHLKWNDTDFIQIVYDFSNNMYQRAYVNSEWTSWKTR